MGDKVYSLERILAQSTAIRTCLLPEVRELVNTVTPDYDSVIHYNTNIINWLSPIIDLTGFSVYPTNGITEGLNWWYNQESRAVRMQAGEYQWITAKNSSNPDFINYQSIPSSIHGNFTKIITDGPVALDLAYVGSTALTPIEINNNVEVVFYSLSKSFGVRNVRTGWIFTRTPDKKLDLLTYNAKYYNYYAHKVAETIIENFSPDYIHSKLHQYQLELCNSLNLTASDSVWLATTNDSMYDKFKRGSINRVCIAQEISTAYSGSSKPY